MTPAPLEAARKLAPQIQACADQTEAERELPRPLFEALADAGMFHLAVPRAIGGGEIDLPTYIQVIEELGKADASTGWVVNQLAIYGTYASRMPRDPVRPATDVTLTIFPPPWRIITRPTACERRKTPVRFVCTIASHSVRGSSSKRARMR